MLFITHFSTFIFASLVFGSMAQDIVPGKVYLGLQTAIRPIVELVHILSVILEHAYYNDNLGLQTPAFPKSLLVALEKPDSATGLVHVAVLTKIPCNRGCTKHGFSYDMPWDCHVSQIKHTIPENILEHIHIDPDTPDPDHWQQWINYQMTPQDLQKVKYDIENFHPRRTQGSGAIDQDK
jgi:hypothetical protein